MANVAPVLPPHELLQAALQRDGLTGVDFARRSKIPYEVVRSVEVQDPVSDPVGLHRLGKILKADMEEWAASLAATLIRLRPADAAASVHGQIWTYLIREGLSLAAAADKHKTTRRAIQLTLSRGGLVSSLRRSSLLAAAGIDPGESGVPGDIIRNEALAELLERQRKLKGYYTHDIARSTNMAPHTVSLLLKGYVPHSLKPTLVPPFAKYLDLNIDELSGLLASTWRTRAGNHGTIKYLVAKHLFQHGLPVDAFAARAGINPDMVRSIFENRVPGESHHAGIRKVLGCSQEEWERAARAQRHKRIAGSLSYNSLSVEVQPLTDIIYGAADSMGLTPYNWGMQYGISRERIRSILIDGVIPRKDDLRVILMRALDIDVATYETACRLMSERHKPRRRFLDAIEARTGVQEAILRLIRQAGLSLNQIAAQAGVGRKTIEKIARYGAHDLTYDVRDRIRQFLGVDASQFDKMMEPIDSGDLEDLAEMRLLSAFRKLDHHRQLVLLELAGRLMGGQDIAIGPAVDAAAG